MKNIIDRVKRSWRAFVTAAFVLMVFTVPASKGIFGKFLGVSAAGNQQQGNNQNNNNNSNSNSNGSNSQTGTFSSHGPPQSNSSASPMNPSDSCSTGRRHNRPHHGHIRANHPHYRPNGR